MADGGVSFGAAKAMLARVVENGVCADDPRVLVRTNEATKALLDEIIPVGGCATYDVVAENDNLVLPKELENAIEVEVLNGGKVHGRTDVTQGWYDMVNQFTYLDASAAHDNPLVDLFLVPDQNDPTILHRKYHYPGLAFGATVRVTGAKRYLPITSDDDYLIIQNIRALKLMILAIEREEANQIEQADFFRTRALEVLTNEVKKHQLDPRNSLRRKAAYQADLLSYEPDQFGHVLAQLALEIPNGLTIGKSDLAYLLNNAEHRLLSGTKCKGSLIEYVAEVKGGYVLFPRDVESIVAASLDGRPLTIRGRAYEYHTNTAGYHDGAEAHCAKKLVDEGERRLSDGQVRRQYKLLAQIDDSLVIRVLAKRRWLSKGFHDILVVTNYEALRLMVLSIQTQATPQISDTYHAQAIAVLEKELQEYLAGIKPHLEVQSGYGFSRIPHLR